MHFELFLGRKAHLDVKINRRLPVWYIYCSISDKCIFSKLVHSAHQLKKDDGTLTTDDTEKATMLNDYFCTIAETLIGPADEIQPLQAHIRENVDMPIMTSITISQKEIKEKICKLKVKKATGPDGVSARLLKYAGMSIAPSLTSVFKQSVEACKPPDQWKIARVSAAFKKDERKTEHVTDHCLFLVYQVN